MFDFKIIPWEETDAGKEFSKKLEKQSQEFNESLKERLKIRESLLKTIDIEALNKPKFERPSGSGCFVETAIIEKPIQWKMFKPDVYYNDNKGNNYSPPSPGSTSES